MIAENKAVTEGLKVLSPEIADAAGHQPSVEIKPLSQVLEGDRKSSDFGMVVVSCLEELSVAKSGNLNMESCTDHTASELETFKSAKLWEGGFMDADPLVPLSWSSYTTNGFVSIYYAMY